MLPITPATDNLYKFVALSGVALVILSIGYPVLAYQQLEEAVVRSNGQLANLRLEVKFLEEDKNTATTQAIAEHRIQERQLELKAQDIRNQQAEIRTFERQLQRWIQLGLAGVVSGLLCAGWGFWRWWHRLQRLQDQVLVAEAADATAAMKSPQSERAPSAAMAPARFPEG